MRSNTNSSHSSGRSRSHLTPKKVSEQYVPSLTFRSAYAPWLSKLGAWLCDPDRCPDARRARAEVLNEGTLGLVGMYGRPETIFWGPH